MPQFVQACLLLAVAAPLLSFAVLMLARRSFDDLAPALASGRSAASPALVRRRTRAGYVACAAAGLSLVAAMLALFAWAGADAEARAAAARHAASHALTWLQTGDLIVTVGLQLDSLTIAVTVMVTLCAFCIHVFSLSYLADDPGFVRFFALLGLFLASMLGLVVSRDLLITFACWELVGICSYFLIGFWYTRPAAAAAARKAVLVNRFGDVGFLIALGCCAAWFGTFQLDALAPALAAQPALFESGWLGISPATWFGLAFVLAAVGKSAQLPLHVWLPDAMEGPTPVSALIHAATMVAAGVYLLARVFPLLTPAACDVLTVLGALTLTLGALLALVQTDLKRVLAYSTISQLGYMVFALGVGAWVAAIFHLLTHAFAKALLFLGAGQVIHACHHEQDLRRLGGLAKRLPRTAITFAIGLAGICGLGLPIVGVGIGGFYSKDELLAVAWFGSHSADARVPSLLLWLALGGALLTPIYLGRAFCFTFLGTWRGPADHPPHEDRRMSLVLLALAGLTLVCGWFLFRGLVADAAPHAPLRPAFESHDHALHDAHVIVGWLTAAAAWIGLAVAFALFARPAALPAAPADLIRVALLRGLYLDLIYQRAVVKPALLLAAVCARIDVWIVDGVLHAVAAVARGLGRLTAAVLDDRIVDGFVRGAGALAWRLGGRMRAAQSGALRHYLLTLAAVAAAAALTVLSGSWRWLALLPLLTLLALHVARSSQSAPPPEATP